jgi:hypothetical protein
VGVSFRGCSLFGVQCKGLSFRLFVIKFVPLPFAIFSFRRRYFEYEALLPFALPSRAMPHHQIGASVVSAPGLSKPVLPAGEVGL